METGINLKELMVIVERESKEREGILHYMTLSPNCIMNCTREKLRDITNCFLTRFDDYIQLAGTEWVDYFQDAYNELEKVFFHLKIGGLVSEELRNSLRCFIKEVEQTAAMELCDTKGYEHGQLQDMLKTTHEEH